MGVAMNNVIELADGFHHLVLWVDGEGDGKVLGFLDGIDKFLAFVSEKGISGLVDALYPGLSMMPNIHPLLIHFPIALLVCFLIMDLLASLFRKETFRIAASWMLYLGTLGAMAAVATGFMAAASVTHGAEVHEVIGRHKAFGLSVLGLATLLSVWRIIAGARFSQMGRGLHFLLAFIMVGSMTLGADLGGLMVYYHGVGVKGVKLPDARGHVHDPVDNPRRDHSH